MGLGKPWHQQAGETAEQYAAFVLFASLLEPTIPKISDDLSIAQPTLYVWKKTFGWVDRAAAWHRHSWSKLCKDHLRSTRRIVMKALSARNYLVESAAKDLPEAVRVRREILTDATLTAKARMDAAESIFRHAGIMGMEEIKAAIGNAGDDAWKQTVEEWVAQLGEDEVIKFRVLLKNNQDKIQGDGA